MSKFILIAIFGLQGMFASLFSQENNAAEEPLKQRLQAFTQAINQGNTQALASFWTDDAAIARPLVGEEIDGKDAIVKFLQQRIKELQEKKLQFSFKVQKIEFPEPDRAIVDGVVEIGNQQGLFVRNARRLELLQDNGQWYINGVNDIEVAPPPPVYTHLKDFDWVIGNWKDQDEDVTITFSNSWDKFKNFIISKFKMSVYGLEAMEGIEIIGWDPNEHKVRSWVFDSDGGFGSGSWTKKGESWEVATDYTLSDGTKASGTNIYTKVDNNHYRFASIDRKVNGEVVPNIEPVTVAREE